MNTKYLAVLFFIASAAAITWPDPHRLVRETCASRSGLSEEQLLVKSQAHFDASLLPYIICYADQFNVWNETTVFDADIGAHILSHAVPNALTQNTVLCCKNQVQKSGAVTRDEKIIIAVQCIRSKIPSVIYNLIGFWGKPVFHHLDTCDVE